MESMILCCLNLIQCLQSRVILGEAKVKRMEKVQPPGDRLPDM